MLVGVWFQFQDGAIRGPLRSGLRPDHPRFNSKMVRLEESISNVGVILILRFQFQDGAIRGSERLIKAVVNQLFQFQDGAIRGKCLFTT